MMKDELETMDLAHVGSITMVDIDKAPDLARQFNELIPVLFVNDIEVCRYKLNKRRLLRILGSE